MTCIIVRHGAFQEYERLHAAFGHLVRVIWDRRRADLDLDTVPGVSYPNRRETPPLSWTAFEFIVVPGGGHVLQPITRVGAYTTATRIHTVTAA